MTLDSGALAVHGAGIMPTAAPPADPSRSFAVSTVCYDVAAAAAARARIPVDGAGGWLDREITRWLDLEQAAQLVCRGCRAVTAHLVTAEHAMLTMVSRTFACARCGATREQRVIDVGPESETDDRTSRD